MTMGDLSVLVGNALYYISDNGTRRILKHDLGTSLISLPRTPYKDIVLTAMIDGELGYLLFFKSVSKPEREKCLSLAHRTVFRMTTYIEVTRWVKKSVNDSRDPTSVGDHA
jgi:hypothetical protein